MLTSYVSQILKAEACGEIAVLPVFDKISADDTPCDVLQSLPPSQDRKQIKNRRFQSRAFMRSRNHRSMRKSTAKRMKTVRLCLL